MNDRMRIPGYTEIMEAKRSLTYYTSDFGKLTVLEKPAPKTVQPKYKSGWKK